MHYYGGMSKEYLMQVYDDFSDPNGHCKILHATEGASTVRIYYMYFAVANTYERWKGLHIPDIEIIVQYGITREVPTALQQGGQGGHSPTGKAIFLLMYEPWVKLIDLAAIEVDTATDPDHPTIPKLTTRSTKQGRTGIAMIKIIQLEQTCIRQLFAAYLKDETCDGKYSYHIGLDS